MLSVNAIWGALPGPATAPAEFPAINARRLFRLTPTGKLANVAASCAHFTPSIDGGLDVLREC